MGTFSDNLLLSLLAFGESTANGFDNWGESANFNFSRLDGKLGHNVSLSLTAGDVTLSASAEASIYLAFTGVLSANRTVNISARPGFWIISNETTGGFGVLLEPDGGSPVTMPQGKSIIYSDGDTPVVVNSSTGVSFLANKNGVNQTGSFGTVKLTFTNEVFDEGGYYDAPNSKWVPPAGRYRITAAFSTKISGGGAATIELRKDGSVPSGGRGFANTSGTITCHPMLSTLVETDGTSEFEIWVSQVEGTFSTPILGLISDTYFCGEAA